MKQVLNVSTNPSPCYTLLEPSDPHIGMEGSTDAQSHTMAPIYLILIILRESLLTDLK